MANLHNLFPQRVTLSDETHQYWHDNGNEHLSFSKFFGFLTGEKPDFDKLAGFVAKRDGGTQETVLAKWKSQTDEGTRIDKALELFAQTGQILQEDADLEPLVKKVLEKYSTYHRCFEQVVVFDENRRTAGSLDKLCLLSNRKNTKFHMNDFKCFEGGMQYAPKGQPWLNYPLNHLPNSKYVKICLQLSYYSLHLENLTDMRCEAQFIDMIVPKKENGKVIGYSNSLIPAPYMKMEIEAALNMFQPQIIATLENNNLQPAF